MPSVKLDMTAFPEEGTQFRDPFQAQVTALLGPERTDAFWQQAAPMFSQLFNDLECSRGSCSSSIIPTDWN